MTQKPITVGIKADGVAESTLQGKFIGAVSSIPTVPSSISSEASGMVILYVGNTTDSYTNGTFYRFDGTAWTVYALANEFDAEDKAKLDGIEAKAQVNKIESIEVAGQTATIDASKKATVSIPEATTSNNGLMTTVQVSKLASIAAGADKTIVDDNVNSTSTNPVQNKVVKVYVDGKETTLQTQINGKVDKVNGKGLSTNDFTDAFESKLEEIEDGAQKNKVTDVQVNGSSVLEGTIAKLGTASRLDSGTGEGNVPVLDSNGKLVNSVIPSLAIGEYVGEVDAKANLVTLTTAEKGDIAKVTNDTPVNNNGVYFLNGEYSVLNDWIQIVGPGSVISVNGKSGVVELSSSDVKAVPVTRTVNRKELSADITLNAGDVGALTKETADATYATIESVDSAQKKIISVTEIEVGQDDWVEVTDMGDFKYRASITLGGCTESMIPQVVFSIDQATSSDYAPICQSGAGYVYIWSTKNDAISGVTVMAIPQ